MIQLMLFVRIETVQMMKKHNIVVKNWLLCDSSLVIHASSMPSSVLWLSISIVKVWNKKDLKEIICVHRRHTYLIPYCKENAKWGILYTLVERERIPYLSLCYLGLLYTYFYIFIIGPLGVRFWGMTSYSREYPPSPKPQTMHTPYRECFLYVHHSVVSRERTKDFFVSSSNALSLEYREHSRTLLKHNLFRCAVLSVDIIDLRFLSRDLVPSLVFGFRDDQPKTLLRCSVCRPVKAGTV